MEVRYYVDPETGLPHIYKHGVTEDEVEYVLSNWQDLRRGRDGSMIAIGQSMAGRILMVVFREYADWLTVISARQLGGRDLRAYRRQMRRRGAR